MYWAFTVLSKSLCNFFSMTLLSADLFRFGKVTETSDFYLHFQILHLFQQCGYFCLHSSYYLTFLFLKFFRHLCNTTHQCERQNEDHAGTRPYEENTRLSFRDLVKGFSGNYKSTKNQKLFEKINVNTKLALGRVLSNKCLKEISKKYQKINEKVGILYLVYLIS